MLRSSPLRAAFAALLCVLPRLAAAETDPSSLAGADATRIGVYPLERLGPADPAYDRLQVSLRTNLALFPHVEAFDLATPKRCKADDLACLVQAGRLSAADQVVHGSVERFTDGYAVRLQLIDVGKTTRREVKQLVHGGAADLAASMELAACQLVTTEPCEGTLEVKGAPGARVLVSSKDVGETPYEGKQRIGRFPVRVTRGALSTEDTMVGLSFHQKTTLELEEKPGQLAFRANDFDVLPMPDLPPLEEDSPPPPLAAAEPPLPAPTPEVATPPAPPPAVGEPLPAPPPPAVVERAPEPPAPPPPAPIVVKAPASAFAAPPAEPSRVMPVVFKSTLVVGGVLLASGLAFGISSSMKASDANDRFDRRALTPGDEKLYDQARFRATAANVQLGLGAVCVAAGALLYVLDPTVLGGGSDVAIDVGPAGVAARGSF